jgi:hypothetical protein
MAELCSISGALLNVACLARQRQIADAVAAAARAWGQVLDLQRHVFGVAIRAAPPPLFQQ